MLTAIRKTVTVQPGGTVQFTAPELKPATEAEVIVLVQETPSTSPAERTWESFIGSGKGLFKSAEEVDSYIRELRDEWDR